MKGLSQKLSPIRCDSISKSVDLMSYTRVSSTRIDETIGTNGAADRRRSYEQILSALLRVARIFLVLNKSCILLKFL